jgi:heme A synthase
MKSVYRVLAYLIVAEVVIQAMAIVFAIAGEGKWIMEGGVLDKAVVESEAFVFPEVLGFAVHGISGTLVIPVTALILLIVSFFTKAPGAVKWALLVLLLVVVQVTLGIIGHVIPILGALHGLNALVLFSVAVHTARTVGRQSADPAEPQQNVAASA